MLLERYRQAKVKGAEQGRAGAKSISAVHRNRFRRRFSGGPDDEDMSEEKDLEREQPGAHPLQRQQQQQSTEQRSERPMRRLLLGLTANGHFPGPFLPFPNKNGGGVRGWGSGLQNGDGCREEDGSSGNRQAETSRGAAAAGPAASSNKGNKGGESGERVELAMEGGREGGGVRGPAGGICL
ncbi:hypothetical protein AXG93_2508s1070 [Marchantia polymorpha subsp. ruderalis]|uniref:Uncharacterized protein n=1 Tax=Marchantia polymorpha subsp. ruderalis TaxID=1480154 RepID=A0A176WE03_MARPO|nr:hypothetical protein AXG93_2508s1070 [Marchantia polymorpha subsp. ruderalis]